ncbi:nitrogenase molybdenum-iron protein alpha chain [Dissulfurimicrobium hydrothermale]|uniref:nitrogenase molybdenum-iron protein alpha chain n=1 Tax=Dissulfurimicrobium hydrothermale TaxID=1750598 RepID=UPI001EDAD555|nr:nitrogenase molybdenum-iron protein alpha chain [Dissulfurimicrobium hydrothermale]UKL13671.1 nitrogenase molybdenum-iron protein alpha chain [Dissulfurimicrobium hydrothermale]
MYDETDDKTRASDTKEFIEDISKAYPTKVARKRLQHMIGVNSLEKQKIDANVRTIPGIITQRGCCYAGCKGVVIGPIVDMIHIVHGPIGCSYYAWLTRRNQGRARSDGKNYLQYCFSTDIQEDNIVFGGEKKLKAAIEEAYNIFKPKAISVHATCPVGLIGDDVVKVSKEMSEKLGINIFGFSCEGYKGVSQSAGHHLANNGLFKNVVGMDDTEEEGFTVNILGEYNIGGDAWEIERIFNKAGIKVISKFSGDGSYDEIAKSHTAKLNIIQCHRSINYMAEMMETKFGIPWIKINFIGIKSMSKSLRKIARFFDDPNLSERIEKIITEEEVEAENAIAPYRERLNGRTAAIFVGGSRAHHYQDIFKDLGMKVIAAGYEFAHRDDYEGRDVISDIKVDADSRNIEQLYVEPDPARFRLRISPERYEQLKKEKFLSYYEGMIGEMESGSLVIDDISHHELEKIIEIYKPDIICSGIKDKYLIEKWGIPSKQLHNYDYGGPFAGYRGAVNFAKDIDMRVNSRVWSYITPPWKGTPIINAEFAA